MSNRCDACGQFSGPDHVCPDVISAPFTQGNQVRVTESGDTAELDYKGSRIRTLDDLLREADVDLSKWYVERHVINKWEVGAKDADGNIVVEPLFQVKAWLKEITPFGSVSEILADFKSDALKASPYRAKILRANKMSSDNWERFLYEVNISDLHFGMYAWKEEAGHDWDSHLARQSFLSSIDRLINRVNGKFEIEKVLFPIGNDLLHVDNTVAGKGGSTTAGTPQDVDTRYPKMFREARRMIVDAIGMLSEVAPVDVVIVPGNHDRERIFFLGDSIESWFRNDENVNVDNVARTRKYYQWESVLLGFTHGKDEKIGALPQIMAHEEPERWAQSPYREWHIGHRHALSETTQEIGGMRVRVVPSISPNDAWHQSKGYMHVRSAEAYLYNQEGYAGTYAILEVR